MTWWSQGLQGKKAAYMTPRILGGSLTENKSRMWRPCRQDPAQPLLRNSYITSHHYFCQVPLLLHQKQALAWLLWRESQKPQGGILGKSGMVGRADSDIVLFHLSLSATLGLLPPFTDEETGLKNG